MTSLPWARTSWLLPTLWLLSVGAGAVRGRRRTTEPLGTSAGNGTSVLGSFAGSLKVVDTLAEAVSLMERGTETLIDDGGSSREGGESPALRRVLHELQGLRTMVGQLRRQLLSDMVPLQAEADRQHSAAESAKKESELLSSDKARLQQGVQDQDAARCREELQRKTWGFLLEVKALKHNLTRSCDIERRRDAASIANLTDLAQTCGASLDAVMFEASRLKADLRDRDQAVAQLQKSWHDLDDERSLLVIERENLQQNVSATRKAWDQDRQFEQKEAGELREKAEELQEDLSDRVDQMKQIKEENNNLRKEVRASSESIASLKHDLAQMKDDKAALLDSMRAFIGGDGRPAAHMLKVAAKAPDPNKVRFAEEWRKTAEIDTYLDHLRPPGKPAAASTTLPHVEASALTKVFGAKPPEMVKVAKATTTPKALQKFLGMPKMPERAPARNATGANAGAEASAGASRAVARRSGGGASVGGLVRGTGKDSATNVSSLPPSRKAGGHASAAGHAVPAAASAAKTASGHATMTSQEAQADVDVARAEVTVASELAADSGAPPPEAAGVPAYSGPSAQLAEVYHQLNSQAATRAGIDDVREGFREADATLGEATTPWEKKAPAMQSSGVTDANVAAAGVTAMQDLFSEADRLIFSGAPN